MRLQIPVLLILGAVRLYSSGTCQGSPAQYEGYRIDSVEIRNPLGFASFWSSDSQSQKRDLKLRAGAPLSLRLLSDDTSELNRDLTRKFAASQQKFKLAYAAGSILDCDTEAKTLRVVYTEFTSVLPSLLPTLEEKHGESDRPSTTAAVRSSDRSFLLDPSLGYNAARGVFGGLNFSYSKAGLSFAGASEASRDSRSGHLDLTGNSGPRSRLWNRADWAATFEYYGAPAGTGRIAEGKIVARFSAVGRQFGDDRVLFRYGAALEGGHQQSGGMARNTAIPDSRLGSLKLYTGLTGRPSWGAFSASYGFQLGTALDTGTPAFRKHLLDLGYSRSFWFHGEDSDVSRSTDDFLKAPRRTGVHRALSLETRLTAGLIQQPQGAPAVERFLGGNELRPFIADSSWSIPGDAFIRGIPENGLGALTAGGSRFYSGNATVSWPVWGKALLPDELAGDPDFIKALNGQLSGAERALANTYRSKDSEVLGRLAAVSEQAKTLQKLVASLNSSLKTIPPAIGSQVSVKTAIQQIRTNLVQSRVAAGLIQARPQPQVARQLVTGLLPSLIGITQTLAADLRGVSEPVRAAELDSTAVSLNRVREALDDLISATPSKPFEEQARRTLAPARRALNVFLNELNIYSIGPVALFDVARVWPTGEGVHYAAGGGVRIALLNLNLTLAYAANPVRTRTEGAGALFFKLDLASLF